MKPILEFEAHNGEITCVQFLKGSPGPDGAGDMIVTGSFDGSLRSWDLEGSKLVHTFKGHTSAVSCLQADSEKLVSGARDGIIRVRKIGTLHMDYIRAAISAAPLRGLLLPCRAQTPTRLPSACRCGV